MWKETCQKEQCMREDTYKRNNVCEIRHTKEAYVYEKRHTKERIWYALHYVYKKKEETYIRDNVHDKRRTQKTYGVATISRLLKIIRLFGEYRPLL